MDLDHDKALSATIVLSVALVKKMDEWYATLKAKAQRDGSTSSAVRVYKKTDLSADDAVEIAGPVVYAFLTRSGDATLEQRTKMLEATLDLFVHGYFAESARKVLQKMGVKDQFHTIATLKTDQRSDVNKEFLKTLSLSAVDKAEASLVKMQAFAAVAPAPKTRKGPQS